MTSRAGQLIWETVEGPSPAHRPQGRPQCRRRLCLCLVPEAQVLPRTSCRPGQAEGAASVKHVPKKLGNKTARTRQGPPLRAGGGKRRFRLFLGYRWYQDHFLTKEMPLLGRVGVIQGPGLLRPSQGQPQPCSLGCEFCVGHRTGLGETRPASPWPR